MKDGQRWNHGCWSTWVADGRSDGWYCVIEVRRSPRASRLGFENHGAPGIMVERSSCSPFEMLNEPGIAANRN